MRLHSHPRMSRIHATIDLRSNIMTIAAPNQDDLSLSLENRGRKLLPQDVEVCGLLCKGCIFGGERASKWLSSVLGVRCWLARYHDVGRTEPGHAYSNEASLLVVSQQSVSYLNSVIAAQRWGKLVESRHFRPNIVVSDSMVKQIKMVEDVANPEDSWEQITIRGNTDTVELNAAGLCARCQMVDIDPTSGMKGNTLRALAQYRRDRGRINFGIFFNGSHDAHEGDAWIEEGSIVEVS